MPTYLSHWGYSSEQFPDNLFKYFTFVSAFSMKCMGF